MSALEVFTVGHSNRSELDLIELLRRHEINTVVDVRSTPYSEWSPQFNRQAIAATLKEHNIAYSYLGDELGVRSDDPSHYGSDGKVVYARLAASEQFRRGLRRVVKGAQRRRLALMCSEQDPINCHRSILIGSKLKHLGVLVSHIHHPDGELESQDALEHRVVECDEPDGLNQANMFLDEAERIRDALEKRGQQIAYVRLESGSERRETA